MKKLITCLVVCVLSGATFATTWTVDDDGKADFDNIQAAVDAASDGDEIIVMPGTYTGNGDYVVNMLGNSVWLHSSAGAEVTIIDGEGTRRGILCENGETSNTIIEGFTITNGYTNGNGGGMANNSSSPSLTDCTFDSNTANWGSGGGMYNTNSNPTLENCTFTGNTADNWGGMYNTSSSPTLTGCTFTNNSAVFNTGGMGNWSSSPTLTDCTFTGNTGDYGGGMSNENNSSPTLTDCIFDGNSSVWQSGGGMYNGNNSNPILTDCIFTNNHASYWGGGMYNNNSSPTLENCTFTGNTANYGGGGMYNKEDSSPTLTDTTVCGNTPDQIIGDWTDSGGNYVSPLCEGDNDGDGVLDSEDNCYLYNPDQADCNENELGDVCDIADGTSTDWDGNGIPDDCECLADIALEDGQVNISDLLSLIAVWDTASSTGDINYDGTVNIADLLILIAAWGVCP